MKINLKRVNSLVHLVAENEDGNEVHIDGAPSIGGEGNGFRPMQLVNAALGGCSSMGLLSILKKQRQEVQNYSVSIEAEREKDKTPSLFENIRVEFSFEGNLNPEKVKRAVSLTMDKYCSVAKILEKTAKITYDVKLNEKQL